MTVSMVGMAVNYIQSAPLHSHSEWEIILNLDGTGTTTIGGTDYEYRPGTILCIPPTVPHSKSSELHFRDIFFQTPDFTLSPLGSVSIFEDDEEKSVETLMFMALRVFHKQDNNSHAVLHSLCETIRQLLLSRNDKPRSAAVERFRNELIDNFVNPEFTVSEALAKTGYCSDHFRRRFRKEVGTTPVGYLSSLRIEYARKLLQQKGDSRISVAEIAFLSGFYDGHYFSRVFKKAVGVTPGQYALEHGDSDIP